MRGGGRGSVRVHSRPHLGEELSECSESQERLGQKYIEANLWVLFDALPCDLRSLNRLDRKIRTF